MPQRPNRDLDRRLARVREFEAGFRRNNKLNLTQSYEGMTLTIFRIRGRFSWSILVRATEDLSFSPTTYETEADAVWAVAKELDVGQP